jgi:transcriptional regulator with PAS, ATPase and Fis domain
MTWQLRIEDPSGETRRFGLAGTPGPGEADENLTIGRAAEASVVLRDPAAATFAARLERRGERVSVGSSPFWIQIPAGAPPARLGDLPVREAQVPLGVTVLVGESRLTVERGEEHSPLLPSQPSQVRPWLTTSPSGREALWLAKKTAATPLSLYLAGETGTGKEVLAHLIHAWSARASGPFVPLHCGALPLSLAESELFGHVKGAFTGAVAHRPGALLSAHNGTLFLDEVAELPLDIQVKLLRFLEDGELRAVGADRVTHADVRLLCATHQPLEKWVEEGRFRRDLYYRLASVTIRIPSLRARPEDIELLASKFAVDLGRTLSSRAVLRLQAHAWPGNVRELRHAVERAAGLAGPLSPVLNEEAFEFLKTPDGLREAPELELGPAMLTLEEMERHMLLKALRLAEGNRATAARILGVARSTLFLMIKRHGLEGPRAPIPEGERQLDS